MGYSAIVYYAKGENGLQRILNNLKEYTEEKRVVAFIKFKRSLSLRFLDRQDNLFNNHQDVLVNTILEKAGNILFRNKFNLADIDQPTRYALYWIFATLLFELSYESIDERPNIPCFTGTSFGEFWAVTMTCRWEHFSYEECILMAYEYGKILFISQKDTSEKSLLELATSFASKYFSDYYTAPIRAFGAQPNLVKLNRNNHIPNFFTPRQTDSLVEVVAKSFYDIPDEELLQKEITERAKRFHHYEYVEF